MKILLLNDDFFPESYGGAAIVVYRLAKKFKDLGHQVLIITTARNKNNAGRFQYEDLEIIKIYSNYHHRFRAYVSLYNPKPVAEVKKIIKDFKPNVVNFHNLHQYLSYANLAAAKSFNQPVFLTLHDVMLFSYGKLFPKIMSSPPKKLPAVDYQVTFFDSLKRAKLRFNPFRNSIIRLYLKYPDKIFSVSQELKEVLTLHGIKNIEVIHNGLDLKEMTVEQDNLKFFKEKFNLSGKKIILLAGRLSAPKGGKVILKAIAKLKNKISNVCLLVASKKEGYGQTMLTLAKNLGIEDNLIITGWLSPKDLNSAYASADICVMPSLCFETFGLVLLEAMAHKLPLVASCFGGPKEIIQDGINGFIVNPYDIDWLAEKIAVLLQNKELAKEMGSRGYQIVKDTFSLERQAKNYLFWYNKFIRKIE